MTPDALSDNLSDALIPEAPDASGMKPSYGKQVSDKAHRFLDGSEAKGGHARAMHAGLSPSDLDARGKKVATSFMSAYDQDKSFAHLMELGGGKGAYGRVAGKPGSGYAAGTVTGDASGSKYRTAPLARVSEELPDGSHRHFNAKVKKGFAKFTRQGGDTRAQTFFPSEYEELPAPLPGGDVPADRVVGDSIEDVKGKLRKTETEERYGGPALGRVVEAPAAAAPELAPAEASVVPPKPERPEHWSTMSKSARRRFNRKLRKWEAEYGAS